MTLLTILARLLIVLLSALPSAAWPRVERAFGPAPGPAGIIATRPGNHRRARDCRPLMPAASPLMPFPFRNDPRRRWASLGPP